MQDFLKRKLEVDDSVIMITPGYRDFSLARVIGFTAQKIRVSFKSPGTRSVRSMLQTSDQLVKVDGPELTMFLLQNGDK